MNYQGKHRARNGLIGSLAAVVLVVLGVFLNPVITQLATVIAPNLIEPLTARAPVIATAGYDSSFLADSYQMALREQHQASDIVLTTDGGGPMTWLRQHDAAVVGETPITLSIQGRRDSGVVVTNMRAIVLSRGSVYDGTRVLKRSAGQDGVAAVKIDLDEPGSIARSVNEDGQAQSAFFSTSVVSLAKNETFTFGLKVETKTSACVWLLELDLLVNGDATTFRIPTTFYSTAVSTAYSSDLEWDWSAEPTRIIPRITS